MDLQGWGELDAAFRQAPAIVLQEIHSALVESDQLLEREVKDATPSNVVGHLKDSIFSREQLLPDGALGVVGTAKPYAVYVELGTKPHFPPVEALEDWVRAKLAVPEKEVHGVALAIARKIAARGTVGVGMFHRIWARLQPEVERICARVPARVAARLAGAAR